MARLVEPFQPQQCRGNNSLVCVPHGAGPHPPHLTARPAVSGWGKISKKKERLICISSGGTDALSDDVKRDLDHAVVDHSQRLGRGRCNVYDASTDERTTV